VGVDSDEIITEFGPSKAASIEPETLSSGYKACLCLDRMMNRLKPEFKIWPGEYRKRARIGVAADSRLVSEPKISENMAK
jgi:hypothetical protein